MRNVLILGAYGLLGCSLSTFLAKAGYAVFRQGRNGAAQISINPLETDALYRVLVQEQFDVIINLIAATDVDQCERDCLYAYLANIAIVERLSNAINRCPQDSAPHLIHISTDQIYDGHGPHLESKISPCNVYALSKAAGEIAARNIGATIFRTNFVGKSLAEGRVSFTDWLVESFRSQKKITLFDDVLFSALHIPKLCYFIEQAVQHKISGTFNIGSADGISKAQFGITLAKLLNLDISNVTVGRSSDIALKAKRPLDMRMNVSKFEQRFKMSAPAMEHTIFQVAQEYINE